MTFQGFLVPKPCYFKFMSHSFNSERFQLFQFSYFFLLCHISMVLFSVNEYIASWLHSLAFLIASAFLVISTLTSRYTMSLSTHAPRKWLSSANSSAFSEQND